jgi:hypothetical protein|tara:strand:- start:790 stop:1251 length:462 start_codon:yes stop_codon:yes gene_type:complete
MATVTSHTQLTVTTTYLDIPIGGNSPGAPITVPDADGTVGDNTAWLSGTAAAGTYPGALTGFQAVNSSSNEPVSGLRLISVMVTGDTGTTQKFAVNAYDSSLSRIYALINLTNNTDTDESLAAAATVVAHETGELTFTVGGATDTTLITLIAG